ncbi:KaiC domain-containing protein [Methanopyrus sp.]
MSVERVPTGIPGMDEVLNGGIPERNAVLLTGGPGTGKTIFSQQFIWAGLEEGEPGVFVTLEEHPVQVRKNVEGFGWNFREYEEEGLLAVVDAFTGGIGKASEYEKYVVKDPTDTSELIGVVRQAVNDVEAKRVAIDSVTPLYIDKPSVARRIMFRLKRMLAGLGCTTILVNQVAAHERGFGGPGVEHAVDGIIRLDLDEVNGKLWRSLIVWKMRGTAHSMRRHPFEITDEGIRVDPDKVFVKERGEVREVEG